MVLAILAVISACLAFVLFARVSRTVQLRNGYTNRLSYKVATYGTFAVFAAKLVVMVAGLIGVLISSLLLIGSDSNIGSLYMQEFVPQLVSTLVVAVVTYFMYKIVRGYNMSKPLVLTILGASAAILLTFIITIAIVSHNDERSSNNYGSSVSDLKIDIPSFSSPKSSIRW